MALDCSVRGWVLPQACPRFSPLQGAALPEVPGTVSRAAGAAGGR